jgi:exopolysaccharide biosynthesis operon protein EpsL
LGKRLLFACPANIEGCLKVRQVNSSSSLGFRAVRLSVILSFAALPAATPALAQTAEGIHPYLAYSIGYDDNVLGLPNAETSLAVTGSSKTSDLYRSAQAGLQLDKYVGRQQFVVNLGVSHVNYDRYTLFDYQGRNLHASWNWHLGNHLDGVASTSYVRTLSSFNDYHALDQRLQTERQNDLEVRWRLHPRWRLRGAARNNELSYDSESQTQTRNEKSVEAGLDYVTPDNTTVGVVARRLHGDYPLYLNAVTSLLNEYDQDEIRGRFDWRVTSKTRVQFDGGLVSRKHKRNAVQDFRGGNAKATVDWEMTGQTFLTATAWRQLGIVDDLFTAYTVNKGMGLGPRWVVSQKLQTDVQFRYESRDFRQSEAGPQAAAFGDVMHTLQWSANYTPSEHWSLQSTLFGMKKDGSGRLASFRRKGATVTLQYIY